MPSFKPFHNRNSSAALFEIRLDDDFIVLRGTESDASSQILKGVVVLCLPTALRVEDVHLRLTGHLKIGWTDQKLTPTGVATNKFEKSNEIFSHRWPPFVGGPGSGSSSRGVVLAAGNYEWPFELVIPGSMSESVEGLNETHIVYKLKATVARGRLAYDLHAWKPLRIVRTLDPAALEFAHTMTVENVWPNKIEYSIVIPQKAIVFGTSIQVDMRFTSLLKGLKIGEIKCSLVEIQELLVLGTQTHATREHKHTREVTSWLLEVSDDHYHDVLDENGQDGWALTEYLPLPKKLGRCMQDVNVQGIKIRHKVKFTVALHNPDGHVSELRATLPITIFISPNIPIDSDGNLLQQPVTGAAQVSVADAHAPPLYGEHVLDQLYDAVDMSGMMTPAVQSGMNTPFYSMSRAGSSDNLAALTQTGGGVAPAALTSRLQTLDPSTRHSQHFASTGSGANTPPVNILGTSHGTVPDVSNSNSRPESAVMSRRNSHDEGLTSGDHTPEHIDHMDMADLSRVPSYSTAIKTPARSNTYSSSFTLPDYMTALSAPNTPPVAGGPTSGILEEAATGTTTPASRSASPDLTRDSLMGFTPIHPTGEGEERRRIQLLQSRDRH